MEVKVSKIDKGHFNIEVSKDNYRIIRKLIQLENEKIVNKLKRYKSAGLIYHINFPRNKLIQSELNELVKKKQVNKKALEQISKTFR